VCFTPVEKYVDVEKYAYNVNKLCQKVGLETWIWRQIVTSQRAHTKYKWPPCAWMKPPMKIFCVRHWTCWPPRANSFNFYFVLCAVNSCSTSLVHFCCNLRDLFITPLTVKDVISFSFNPLATFLMREVYQFVPLFRTAQYKSLSLYAFMKLPWRAAVISNSFFHCSGI